MRKQSLFLNRDKIIKGLGDDIGISLAYKVDIVKFGNGLINSFHTILGI